MAYEATPAATRAIAAVRDSEAVRVAWRVLWTTRLAVLVVAIFAALSFGPATGGLARVNALKFDEPELTHAVADPLFAPLARWDSVWYLRIADSGYGDSEPRAAFFPLYPLLIHAGGTLGGGSKAALLIASYAIALAALLAALVLLHKLVSLELGRRYAGPALLLLAVFPAALYFGAPYSESLFLLLAVGAFYAARTERWAWAGACAAGASATRSAGVLLLLPLAVLYLYGPRGTEPPGRGAPAARAGARLAAFRPRHRIGPDIAWLVLAPLGLVAYVAWLGLAEGDPWRFLDVQDAWSRELSVPLGAAWEGLTAAVDGVRQLASGRRSPVYFEVAAGDPFRIAAINIMLFASLLFAAVACVGVFRRLPKAYGLWMVVALLVPLSFPVTPQPLMSLPRFLAVLFPIFMWLALVCEERRITAQVAAVSAVGLGLFTAQFATWHWIS